MTEPVTAETAPVLKLDDEAPGMALKMLPVIARHLGHKSVRATLGYGYPTTPEAEFVRDVLQMTATDLIAKWYGDEVAELYERQAAENVAAMVRSARRRTPADPAA